MIRATNIKRGRIVPEGLIRIEKSSIPQGRDAVLTPGEIVVVRSGAYTGDSALVTPEWTGSVVGYDLVVSPDGTVDSAYLAMWLLGDAARVYFGGQRHRSAQPHLNRGQLGNAIVTFPPLAEQRQIAAVLSAVQRAIDRQERLIALTAELKRALMHKLFTEGTPGESLHDSEIGPVPSSWRVEPLGEHLLMADYGLSAKGSEIGKIPILRMTNQVDGHVVPRDLQFVSVDESQRRKYRLEPGDLLFNRTNSFDLVGRTALFDLSGEYLFASYLIRLRVRGEMLRPAFLNHYLNWPGAQRRLKGIATRAVSQSNISASRLRQFLVPVPSFVEQDEVSESLDGVDQVIALHQRRLAALQDLFRSLLQQLMTAQLRVDDLDLSAFEAAAQEPVGAA
jgi:type I restriction enzyme S subunit